MSSAGNLIVVAHPKDEVLSFSSVAKGAVIVAATDFPGFEEAGAALGASETIRLGLFASPRFRLPSTAIAEALGRLGSFSRVYTHSPLDPNPMHQDVALAVARTLGAVRVPSTNQPLDETYILDPKAYSRKLELLNRFYAPHLEAEESCIAPAAAVSAIEAFSDARAEDMMRATSLTHFDRVLDEAADTWAFERSPYERMRFKRSADLIAQHISPPKRIIELGACEGLMTLEIARRYPAAQITAVEPNPRFAARIRERLAGAPNVEILERSADVVDLRADLVIAAEVLYYLPDRVAQIVARIDAPYVFTSYHGPFDHELAALLGRSHFAEIGRDRLPIRFEPTDGDHSPFLVRRVGATMRLFGRTTV